MKVAFDIKNLWLYGKGIGVFTTALLYDLASDRTHSNIDIELHCPSFEEEAFSFLRSQPRFIKVETGKFNKNSRFEKVKYDQISLLKSLRQSKPDVLFSPYFDIPYFWNKPFITTVHDLFLIDRKADYNRFFFLYYKTLLEKTIRKAASIVTVSEYSKQRILEQYRLPDEKVKVISNKVHPEFLCGQVVTPLDTVAFKKKYSLPEEFILYTGGLESRKNVELLIEGIRRARANCSDVPKLVITGISQTNITVEQQKLLDHNFIILTGYLPVSDVVKLYNFASLIVNTSTYEGFGIPVLEALTLKKPMLCSDIPPYKEVGQDLVYYFDNNNIDSFENSLICFFKGKLPAIDTQKMQARSLVYNNVSYSDSFFELLYKFV